MKKLNLGILLFLICWPAGSFAQKIQDFKKVTSVDFSGNIGKSVYLDYRSLISFPYAGSNSRSGAMDRYFGLKHETHMRIFLYGEDTTAVFYICDSSYNSKPKIISLSCYYRNGRRVTSEKIMNPSTELFVKPDQGYFVDLSPFKKGNTDVVIDLVFSYPIKSKKKIDFYLDRKMDYRFLTVEFDVPEIYKYSRNFDHKYITDETSKTTTGPVIGYRLTNIESRNGPRLYSKASIDQNQERINADYKKFNISHRVSSIPVTCRNTRYTYNFIQPIEVRIDSAEQIISVIRYRLMDINEITE